LAVKLGANNPKSCIIFFRMCRDYLEKKAIQFLEKHKEWAIALGFNKGVL
jgi:hypothetical protein